MPPLKIPGPAARSVIPLVAALAVAGCAAPPPGRDRAPETASRPDAPVAATASPTGGAGTCDPCPGTPARGGMLMVALPDTYAMAHAPEPANEAERTVFRNLYETLITIDCDGEARPGLAEAWSAADDGRRWTFTLRAAARFWDGRPVTAQDVKTAWTATQRRAQTAGCLLPWAWLDAEAASVRLLDARRLSIQLPEPQADFPLLLAHPAYAVALPTRTGEWPLGTGIAQPGTVVAATRHASGQGGGQYFRPNPHHPGKPPAWEQICFRRQGTPGKMDGRRIDITLHGGDAPPSPASGDGVVSRLPWNRIVLFLCPAGGGEAERWTANLRPDEALPDSRPADMLIFPGAWGETCPQLAGPAAGRSATVRADSAAATPPGRLLYPAADPIAREIARQLAKAGDGETIGLDDATWPAALREGRATGYVMSVSRCYATPCLQLAALLGSASWLQNAALGGRGSGGVTPVEASRRLIATGVATPLAMTRASLTVRPGIVGLRVAPDGALLLAGAGFTGPP